MKSYAFRVQPRKGCGAAPSSKESYLYGYVYKPVERGLSRSLILMVTESDLYGYVYKPVERGLSLPHTHVYTYENIFCACTEL